MIANTDKKYLFIIYISGEWETYHRRIMFENMASFIGEKAVFLIINRPVDFIASPFIHSAKFKKYFYCNNIERLTSNIYLYTPKLLIHDQIALKLRPFVYLNRAMIKRQLNMVIKEMDWQNHKTISWHMHPNMVDYLNIIDSNLKVYDCYDEFSYNLFGQFLKDVSDREKKILQSVDVCIATSHELVRTKSMIQPNTHYVHQIVDHDNLMRASLPETEIINDLKEIKKPVIGYLGVVKLIIDEELLAYIATERPSWSIVLAGPDGVGLHERMKKFENIYFIGRQNYKQYANVLKGFDVAVIPYAINNYTSNVNPNKLQEYMVAGCRIVSTAIKEADKYESFIKIANSKEEFVLFIDEYLNEPVDNDKKKLQIETALSNSSETVAKIFDILNLDSLYTGT